MRALLLVCLWLIACDTDPARGGPRNPPVVGGTSAGSSASASTTGGMDIGAGTGGSGGSDAGEDFGNATPLCTAEELTTDCMGLECGPAPRCGGSCGSCAADAVCRQGACLDPAALCAVDPSQCECTQLEFTINTYAACSISLVPGATVDGEAFIMQGGEQHRVLAINRYGKGHVIAWCDSSTNDVIERELNGFAYLTQKTEGLRVASFGRDSLCSTAGGVVELPPYVEYLGFDLPAKYLGDPAQLAADYDALMICGWKTMWDPGWAPLIQSYIAEYGKGLFAAMDYEGLELKPMDFEEMSKITEPAGITFNSLLFPAAPADASVGIECLPDYVPRPE